jgi:hypothetical protein
MHGSMGGGWKRSRKATAPAAYPTRLSDRLSVVPETENRPFLGDLRAHLRLYALGHPVHETPQAACPPPMRFHDLRHGFAPVLLVQGVHRGAPRPFETLEDLLRLLTVSGPDGDRRTPAPRRR